MAGAAEPSAGLLWSERGTLSCAFLWVCASPCTVIATVSLQSLLCPRFFHCRRPEARPRGYSRTCFWKPLSIAASQTRQEQTVPAVMRAPRNNAKQGGTTAPEVKSCRAQLRRAPGSSGPSPRPVPSGPGASMSSGHSTSNSSRYPTTGTRIDRRSGLGCLVTGPLVSQ